MSNSHEVMFYTDGRHTSVYLHEPPMGEKRYVEPIDELVDLGIDTITYAVGDCSVLLYATEAGERWGHNVDLTGHDIWWRAAHNLRLIIDSGVDPLMLVCEHAQMRGFQFLPSLLLNMLHTPPDRVTNCRVANFTTEHPQWQVGPEPDFPEAEHDQPNRLSYAVPQVRANRLAVIKELVNKYPCDGIELNMYDYAPFIARREVEEHTATLTEWMRDIRKTCDDASAEQGRSKRLVVRTGSTVAGNKAMGMDLETWVRDGIVDAVLAMQVVGGFDSDTTGLREIVAAAQTKNVKVLAGIEAANQPEFTVELNRAAATNAYAAGAKGVLFHTYYPMPGRYPYDNDATGRIRFMGHPDLLAQQDKTFRVSVTKRAGSANSYGLSEQLPQALTHGEAGEPIRLEVSDDVVGMARLGQLWRCELKVMLQHLAYEDQVRLLWNDQEIPESQWRKADWTYQVRPRPEYAVNGYRLHVDLKEIDHLPCSGVNTVQVEVLKKDPQLIHAITIVDVELQVQYLPHRNGLRADERF